MTQTDRNPLRALLESFKDHISAIAETSNDIPLLLDVVERGLERAQENVVKQIR